MYIFLTVIYKYICITVDGETFKILLHFSFFKSSRTDNETKTVKTIYNQMN